MINKFKVPVEPLFSNLDRRRLVPLAEVSRVTGYASSQLRIYAITGAIPGGRQAAKGKRWFFEREALEKWWQQLNAPKAMNAQNK